jgi:hypothetical protein
MKGLQQYIRKHGLHFTVELALKAGGNRWSEDYVLKKSHGKVYYNVIEATLGDMVFLTNRGASKAYSVSRSIHYTLDIVGDYSYNNGKLFLDWLDSIISSGTDFDFTDYI